MKAELKPSVKERSIKAFVDLAILCALTNKSMTGYEVNNFFVRKFGILVGPSNIYAKLFVMERKGWIKSVQSRTARVFSLNDQGQEITSHMDDLLNEIQEFNKYFLKPSRRKIKI